MTADAHYHPTILELPSSERPRERLLYYGANALSTAELLAIVLRINRDLRRTQAQTRQPEK